MKYVFCKTFFYPIILYHKIPNVLLLFFFIHNHYLRELVNEGSRDQTLPRSTFPNSPSTLGIMKCGRFFRDMGDLHRKNRYNFVRFLVVALLIRGFG